MIEKIYNYKKILLVSLMLIFFSWYVVMASSVEVREVSKDKVWKVTFNKHIKEDEAFRKQISVFDENGEKVHARIEIGKEGNVISIKPPIKEYNQGETYTLKISKNIYSLGNKRLKNEEEMKFKIVPKDNFEGYTEMKEEENIKSDPGKKYIFDKLRSMIDEGNKKVGQDGYTSSWRIANYRVKKSGNVNTYLENKKDDCKLKLPNKFNGWFAVYIGCVSGTNEFKVVGGENKENIKIVESNIDKENQYLKEEFAFVGNFKDDPLSIEALKDKKVRIAYVKMVPLEEKDAKLYNKQSQNKKDSKAVYTVDGYSEYFDGKCPDVKALENFAVDSIVEGGAGGINYQVGTTGLLNYNSEYAGPAFKDTEKYDPYIREGDKLAREQILNILSSGKSPIDIVATRGKAKGIEVSASFRMNAFYNGKSTEFLNGTMYEKYQDCKQNNACQLSYYYPKYRDYVIGVLKEIAEKDNVEHINLDFCRYPKVMGSEASIFEKIEIMNNFMRRVRKELPNKKISVRIPYLNPMSYGLNVSTWVNEGLVDRIIPCSISYEDFYDLSEYESMVKDSKVELYGGVSANLKGRDLTKEDEDNNYVPKNEYLSAEDYLYRAHELYTGGADGIFLFNSLTDIDFTKEYSPKLKLLGNKEEVEKWYKLQYPSYLIHDKVEIY